MKTNYSSRDWELLSEYLDEQLHPRKRAGLEARLQQDADLRAALDDLRHTRAILRSAPPLKAPRNFTLKPHMLPERSQRRIYPLFQFASAMASVLLVLALVGDLLGVSVPVGQPAQMAQPAMEIMMAPEEPHSAARALPEAEGPVESAERVAVPPEEVPAAAPPAIMQAPLETAEAESEIAGLSSDDMQKISPLATGEAEVVEVPEEMIAASAPAQPVPVWRYLQVSLALVALATAALAVYFRRMGQ
jgi:anti-sigma-K factor RskA